MVTHNIMAIRMRDKREVYLLSTMHKNAEKLDTGKRHRGEVVRKPRVIQENNKHMGGVDSNEAL